MDDKNRISEIEGVAKQNGVIIRPPDINISSSRYTIKENQIYSGLLSIKGIGEKACNIIVAERDRLGKYTDFTDLRKRIPAKQLNSAMMKAIIEANN
jgi:DNA polymerase-3 subunit alpha